MNPESNTMDTLICYQPKQTFCPAKSIICTSRYAMLVMVLMVRVSSLTERVLGL